MQYTALIMAAGSGSRMGLDYNKLLYPLADGSTVLEKSVSLFQSDPRCAQLIIVCAPVDRDAFERLCGTQNILYVNGGATRQDSVYQGLKEVTQPFVLIHDGARPWLTIEYIDRLLEALVEHSACLLGVPVKDTIKEVENGMVKQTYDRSTQWAAQTPQAFRTELIRYCHERAQKDHITATDDAQLVEWYGEAAVLMIEGSDANVKVTTMTDIVGK